MYLENYSACQVKAENFHNTYNQEFIMAGSHTFLEYFGPMDFAIADSLLIKLKKTNEFKNLNKTTSKRVYSVVVECLENIWKHSDLEMSKNGKMNSHLSVGKENDSIIVCAGNPLPVDKKENITDRLDHINNMDVATLKSLHENKINADFIKDEKCAGLGLIQMALKSGNKINYSFNYLTTGFLYFEIVIKVNKYIMRKLIIDQKPNSPKIILDPENKVYMISGESRPYDVREFYEPVILWLEEFSAHLVNSESKNEPVIFNFDFEYFNSSSGKLILDICKILAKLRQQDVSIGVNWHFEKDDYDMLEAGKEFSSIVKFPFDYVMSNK